MTRKSILERMAREEFDLLVIGGGITGAGLARDAALRGLRVALAEKEDFGYGTSSRSSKLVHGGIRYLAQGDLAMVRESARERKALRKIAPHLVHPLPFVFPVYHGDSLAFYRTGFFLFDRLAGSTPADRHQVLTPTQVRTWAPGLRDPLTGGFLYGEYLTDDSRFTMENALSAAAHGAAVANHLRVTALRQREGQVVGAEVEDVLTGDRFAISAHVVVNATGPWAEQTLLGCGMDTPKPLLLSKGIHLLFPASRLPLGGAVVLKSPGGAEGFAIRRWDYVYVGTTDVVHPGEIDRPVADEEAVVHLLTMAQECFPEAGLTADDIITTWAGVRPLIAQPGKGPRETSRHDEIWQIKPGLLTVAGGKLTTYRAMANRIMEQVARALGRPLGDGRRTAEVPLPNAPEDGNDEGYRCRAFGLLADRQVDDRTAERLAWLYGTAVDRLLRYGEEDPEWLLPLAPGTPALRGEVRLAVEQEMAQTLEDFMDRRAALLMFSDDQGQAAAPEAAQIMGDLLGWSDERRAAELANYRTIVRSHQVPLLQSV